MKRHKLHIKETIATVIAEDKYIPAAREEVMCRRKELEDYIVKNPAFSTSLKPCEVSADAPEIVQKMASASAKAGIGPMAAVAGSIAEYAVRAMIGKGASHVIFDNGGDIAMFLSSPVIVGIYAGKSGIKGLGFRFEPRDEIIGICTSSATVGYSLSLGRADAAVVVSSDVILADVVATALGNAVKNNKSKQIEESLNTSMIDGIEGMMAVIGDSVGMCGSLPELCRADVDYNLISRG